MTNQLLQKPVVPNNKEEAQNGPLPVLKSARLPSIDDVHSPGTTPRSAAMTGRRGCARSGQAPQGDGKTDRSVAANRLFDCALHGATALPRARPRKCDRCRLCPSVAVRGPVNTLKRYIARKHKGRPNCDSRCSSDGAVGRSHIENAVERAGV